MRKALVVALALALSLCALPLFAQATNVSSDWSGGNLSYKDKSGNAIFTIDGTNRYLTIPSGSSIVLASGATLMQSSGSIVSRNVSVVIPAHGKAGATAGWTVAAAANRSGALLPASQSNSTLVIAIQGLQVGDIITGFSLAGQIESAGNTATITAELRSLTVAAADLTDASVGAMAAPLSVTADTALSSLNAVKTGLSDTVAANEQFYLLVTGTTAASTDIDLAGLILYVTRQ
jgi:hypothetical protein